MGGPLKFTESPSRSTLFLHVGATMRKRNIPTSISQNTFKKNKIAKAGARRPQREPAATSCQLLKLHMSLGLKGFERDTALRLSDRRHFTQDLVTLHPSAAAACYGFRTRICKAFSMLFQRSFSLSHFKQFGLFRTSLAQHPPETPLCTPALLAF